MNRLPNWVVAGLLAWTLHAEELVRGRPSLVLRGDAAQLTVDLAGGSLADFHLGPDGLNPLSWATPAPGDTAARGFGHFLCLDRWGPPSEAEGRNGMPYHGEAAGVRWQPEGPVRSDGGVQSAVLSARLPLAGLSVRRTLRLSQGHAYCVVREEVRNDNRLGRILNRVQHPTIGRPFLDETTRVDANGAEGFAQGGSLPDPEKPTYRWPRVRNAAGQPVDLRRLAGDPKPDVVSFVVRDEFGWVTAATPRHGLLIGYLWRTRDYPWFSVWRDVDHGRPAARGLEFGTTGLHQPFGILAQKGRIFDRPLFEHLDAGEARTRSYALFLARVPDTFAGVGSLEVLEGRLVLHERGRRRERDITVEIGELP